jgi:hypothetical protein
MSSPYRRDSVPLIVGQSYAILEKIDIHSLDQVGKLMVVEVNMVTTAGKYFPTYPAPRDMATFGKYYPTPDALDPDRNAFVGGLLGIVPGVPGEFFVNLQLIYTPATGQLDTSFSIDREDLSWLERIELVVGAKLPYRGKVS